MITHFAHQYFWVFVTILGLPMGQPASLQAVACRLTVASAPSSKWIDILRATFFPPGQVTVGMLRSVYPP